ncbi:MAG: hypothetical protein JJU02_15955 [Cryomorphaceae bacterium]|nr:hypothetical protein [Cryomorphaceae bacterium]
MRYCRATTCEHPFSRSHESCIEVISAVLRTEGCKQQCRKISSEAVCLNVDKVEESLASREQRSKNSTVDFVFGIREKNRQQIVLCELKCNQKEPENFNKSNIDQKVRQTQALIGRDVSLYEKPIVVFKSKILQQMQNRVRRAYNNRNLVEVLDVNGLGELFF